MTYSSDSSDGFTRSNQEAESLQASLQTGLAALKQKDYGRAIAYLEACQTSPDASIRLKAQMGLIKAYVRTDQIETAQALCKPLCQSPNPQVQAWARQTLAELADRQLDRSLETSSGNISHTADDATGFEPSATDTTGFVPLTQPPAPGTRPMVRSDRPIPSSPTPSTSQISQSDQSDRPPARPTATNQTSLPQSSPQTAHPSSQALIPQPRTIPQSTSSAESRTASALIPTSRWRNAGRSAKWTSLGPVDASGLWALEVGSLVLLFWMLRSLVQWLFGLWNGFSIRLNWITGLPRLMLPTDLTLAILVLLGGVFLASPWLLDRLLKQWYGLRAFSPTDLERYSPESNRLLKRLSSQRRQPAPTFKLLPDPAPLIFTYGYLPRNARIVVSQGLFDQLNEDEIASLLAAELSHLRYWDVGVLSGIVLVAQLPYRMYWSVAAWGDRQHDRVLKTVAAAISSLGYGLFWLLRLPGLWLSRVRLYYSDRWATELTGNPNGLSRALLKLAIGTAETIQQQKQTNALFESFEMLLAVGYRQALTIGSLYQGDASVLAWDRQSPYRRWLILNNSHPSLGERLDLLMQYGHRWRLEPELLWPGLPNSDRGPNRGSKLHPNLRRLLLQGAPFWGIPIGLGVAMLLWAFGWVARQFRWFEVAWLAGDQSVLWACCLLGFSIGMFLRINPSFPDIKPSNLQINPPLSSLLTDPEALPIDRQPVQLQGRLIGRRGFQNWLYRDLILQTATGSIRLHYTSSLGWIGDLFPKALRPPAVIDRVVTVTGWFRRGATPWIDVETIQTEHSRTLRSYHPIWSTVLASVTTLFAVYLILRGA